MGGIVEGAYFRSRFRDEHGPCPHVGFLVSENFLRRILMGVCWISTNIPESSPPSSNKTQAFQRRVQSTEEPTPDYSTFTLLGQLLVVIFSDGRVGRFKTTVGFLGFYLVGTLLLILSSIPVLGGNFTHITLTNMGTFCFFVAQAALGSVVVCFAADQFDRSYARIGKTVFFAAYSPCI